MTSSNPHDRTQSARLRLALLVGLVSVLLVALGLTIWLAATRGVEAVGISGDQDQVQAERDRVRSQTEQFMLRMGTFGPDLLDDQGGMPEYRERVTEVITPKFATSFEKEVGTAEQLVSQAGVSREAEVFATGVSVMDADSATALVAGSFTDTYAQPGKAEPAALEPVPFRIEVTLVKTDGEWLVDDFTPVTGAEQ